MKTEKNSVFTEQELAEAHVFAHNLTVEEQKEVDTDMKIRRLQRLAAMSDSQKMQSDLLRLQFLMEDYIQQETYSEKQSFSTFLQSYLKILDKN